MLYQIGDRFRLPHREGDVVYTISKMNGRTVVFSEDGEEVWTCGEWYLYESVDEGSMVFIGKVDAVALDEELFTV